MTDGLIHRRYAGDSPRSKPSSYGRRAGSPKRIPRNQMTWDVWLFVSFLLVAAGAVAVGSLVHRDDSRGI